MGLMRSVICLGAAMVLVGCSQTADSSYTDRALTWKDAGRSFESDPRIWFLQLQELAGQEDPYASVQISFGYLFGRGISPNIAESKEWMKRAERLGEPSAAYYSATFERYGWPRSELEFMELMEREAHDNAPYAQLSLGLATLRGDLVPKNERRGHELMIAAANAGVPYAQGFVAGMYAQGRGVVQDPVQAHKWMNLAASALLPSALRDMAIVDRDRLSRSLATYQLVEAQRLARDWSRVKIGDTDLSRNKRVRPVEASSGTSFIVNREGYLITNFHVVQACLDVYVQHNGKEHTGRVVAKDQHNDLAMIKLDQQFERSAAFRSGEYLRSGESVVAIGFPLRGLLASAPSVTTGIISAIAGLRDDVRFLQITAPVQPGNSGGPLLDESGRVAGIVVSKLDALKVAAVTGDVPQNVNFALNAAVAKVFMEAHGIDYEISDRNQVLETADIAEIASAYTLPVVCR